MSNKKQRSAKSNTQTSAHIHNVETMVFDGDSGFGLPDDIGSTDDNGRIRQGAGCRLIPPDGAKVEK